MKKIKDIAMQLVALEKEYEATGKSTEVERKMNKVIASLSLQELLEVDEYILNNNLLKDLTV